MARFTLTLSRQFDVTPPLRLAARIAGNVRVRGWEQDVAKIEIRVDVRAPSRRDAEQEGERLLDGIVYEEGTLTIESPDSDGSLWRAGIVRVEYEIDVPRQTSAGVHVANGPVLLKGINGPLEGHVANGPVILEDVGSDVSVHVVNGPLDVKDFGGALNSTVVNGPLRAERVWGPVDLRVTNGPIEVVDTGLAFTANVLNGPIRYEGGVGGDFDLTADNGGIVLRLPADSRFELDAEAERGSVESEFEVMAEISGPPSAHRLKLRTNQGDIHLRRSRRPAAVTV